MSITIGVQPHRLKLLDRRRAGQQLRAPADRADALGEHAHEAAVGVDDGRAARPPARWPARPGAGRGGQRPLERFHCSASVEAATVANQPLTTPSQDFHIAATRR